MLRFPLVTFFLLLTVAAVGCAAFVHATDIWRQSVATAVFVALLLSVLAAVFRDGNRRTFAIGFAVAGWLYFSVTVAGLLDLRGNLLTDRAVLGLAAMINEDESGVETVAWSPQGNRLALSSGGQVIRFWNAGTGRFLGASGEETKLENARRVGHCMWTLVFAVTGGIVGVWLRGRRPRVENRSSQPSADA